MANCRRDGRIHVRCNYSRYGVVGEVVVAKIAIETGEPHYEYFLAATNSGGATLPKMSLGKKHF